MVLKKGKAGLNTGNTIRSRRSHHIQTYGFIQSRALSTDELKKPLNGLVSAVPDTKSYVEYSLNKKNRWTFSDTMKAELAAHDDDSDLPMELFEHRLSVDYTASELDRFCSAYYSNVGTVREKESDSKMNIKSARQFYSPLDHVSKKERRKMKKRDANMRENAEVVTTPKFTCHVSHSTPLNAKMLHITQRNLRAMKRFRNDMSGKTKCWTLGDEMCDLDELLEITDDTAETNSMETMSVSSRAVPLCELVKGERRKRRRHLSASSKRSSNSNSDNEGRKGVVFVDEPLYPANRSTTIQTETVETKCDLYSRSPFMPEYTEVIISNTHSVDTVELKREYGNDFVEAFCTPRVFSINLESRLREHGACVRRCHIVFVLRAECGDGGTHFRVYLVGSDVDQEKARISGLESNRKYDVAKLVDAAVNYAADALSLTTVVKKPQSVNHDRTVDFVSETRKWQVKSSFLDDLKPELMKRFHEETTTNILNSKADDDMVFIPTQYQRSTSCGIHCGICFEDLDDSTLHSALLPCRHYFCNECWSRHITSTVREGSVHVKCPEYNCDRRVDNAFIMATVDFETYLLYESQLTEFTLFSTGMASWCPVSRCGRVLHCRHTDGQIVEPVTVNCTCGKESCFRCMNEPHWPLQCHQLTAYHSQLRKDGVFNIVTEVASEITVHTKPCPKCHTAIDKNGGCVHMHCSRCNTQFCWKCGKEYIGTEYYHDCVGGEKPVTDHLFSFGLPQSKSSSYNSAVRHRVEHSRLNLTALRNRVSRKVSQLSLRRSKAFTDSHSEPLSRITQQIITLVSKTHQLMEFCHAYNHYNRKAKIASLSIDMVEYSLLAVKRELEAPPSNTNLDRLIAYYHRLQNHTRKLVDKIGNTVLFH